MKKKGRFRKKNFYEEEGWIKREEVFMQKKGGFKKKSFYAQEGSI